MAESKRFLFGYVWAIEPCRERGVCIGGHTYDKRYTEDDGKTPLGGVFDTVTGQFANALGWDDAENFNRDASRTKRWCWGEAVGPFMETRP